MKDWGAKEALSRSCNLGCGSFIFFLSADKERDIEAQVISLVCRKIEPSERQATRGELARLRPTLGRRIETWLDMVAGQSIGQGLLVASE